MKRSSFPFVVLALVVGCWFVLLASLYRKGEEKEAIIYAEIPEETIRFFTDALTAIDQFITYDPDATEEDWDNNRNYGEDEQTGLLKLEDEYFIVYFAKGSSTEEDRAQQVLRWAHEAIAPLADLMGKYYYPADVRGRKLPVYLADTQQAYTRIIAMLLEKPDLEEQDDSWGVYINTYSSYGCLTKGIVMHPGTWSADEHAKATLWHEMNHYIFYTSLDYSKPLNPYLWVSEGLAEYFSKTYPRLTEEAMERLQQESLDKTFKYVMDNYTGGQTIYCTLEEKYGNDKLRRFIRQTYSSSMEEVYPQALQLSRSQFEAVWKGYLEHFEE